METAIDSGAGGDAFNALGAGVGTIVGDTTGNTQLANEITNGSAGATVVGTNLKDGNTAGAAN